MLSHEKAAKLLRDYGYCVFKRKCCVQCELEMNGRRASVASSWRHLPDPAILRSTGRNYQLRDLEAWTQLWFMQEDRAEAT